MKTKCPVCKKYIKILEPYNIIGFHGPGFNDTSSPVCGGTWSSIAPRITDDHPFAGALLAEVNRRRGYAWPVIQKVEKR